MNLAIVLAKGLAIAGILGAILGVVHAVLLRREIWYQELIVLRRFNRAVRRQERDSAFESDALATVLDRAAQWDPEWSRRKRNQS